MTPSQQIDAMIAGLDDWRGKTLAELRRVIIASEPGIVEAWKWMGSPVWEKSGIIAVGNPHKGKVKLTFEHGAHLPDPEKLFNAGLEGNQRRAIDLFEADSVNEPALQALVRAAIAHNLSRRAAAKAKKVVTKPKS